MNSVRFYFLKILTNHQLLILSQTELISFFTKPLQKDQKNYV